MRDYNHYGRQRLFTYLLNTSDSAVWVVGSRRIGKTSLLRQLEFLTDSVDSDLVPLFWDMQGCANSGDLSFELYMAIEDAEERFRAFGVSLSDFEGLDALVILRRLGRTLAAAGKTLLLLIDEAEVLISIARTEAPWLARLRKVLQDGHQRTILTSTKLLAQLNELTADWETSPFLFGFSMVNLWSLDPEASGALVAQQQSGYPLAVDPLLLEEILEQTNRHPYLLQYLCQRLYVEQFDGRRGLRPIADEDLEPDHLLAGFFMIDFQHLTGLERRILLEVAEHTVLAEPDLLHNLRDQSPERVRTFLWGMEKLGYVRQVMGQWAVGNEYLRRWLKQEWESLRGVQSAALNETSFEELLQLGYTQENQAFQTEVSKLESSYAELVDRQHRGERNTGDLEQELERLQRYLSAARRDLNRAGGSAKHRSVGDGDPSSFRAHSWRDV